ncbi:ceramide glucosyltransferase [Sporothrix schenckii 1099-18]|uniref:Ceramide glucosyltransferase n=1 Tax=Sporothrix schenckii 1099-18 TaxID=1397361 RepID=A0A0F2MJW2_SPOSC|nr:ceramide glucosyltransferase [Sporothrix schenckii 1099-18]KJR89978.1 ceramide glucosyltransferase [Sporothrix schenckii 1099-18]
MFDLVTQALAAVWGVWTAVVFVVQGIGIFQLFRHYSSPPRRAAVEALADHAAVPHVTVIRPTKGLEPGLYECLASTCRQTYPRDRLSVHLCVESRTDPAFSVFERIVRDFPDADVRVFVEEEDPLLHGAAGHVRNLGPNPKIRNISRAYREAPADGVVWIVDCNVWVAPGVAGRMVDRLLGLGPDGTPQHTPYKFVHQLPLVVDIGSSGPQSAGKGIGAALDEMFMATSHAKFYSAINTVGIAPCIVGKSNMFRKAHLDALTDPAQNPTVLRAADGRRGRGVDFFSSYICEDHLIGDLLWRSPLATPAGVPFRNHALATGDLAIQPMADVPVRAYAARRVRWLRVRKWTVLLATLVEPGVESLLCAFYGSFALTTWGQRLLGPAAPALAAWLPPPTWAAMARCWCVLVALWMAADWCTYRRLQACRCVAWDADTPAFAKGRRRPGSGDLPRRPFFAWARAWLGRELLALPIWTYAVLLGATVAWRGKQFHVRMDMSVDELDDQGRRVVREPRTQGVAALQASTNKAAAPADVASTNGNGVGNGNSNSRSNAKANGKANAKARVD